MSEWLRARKWLLHTGTVPTVSEKSKEQVGMLHNTSKETEGKQEQKLSAEVLQRYMRRKREVYGNPDLAYEVWLMTQQ